MNDIITNRRMAIAALTAMLGALRKQDALAQFTEQDIRNGDVQVVQSGNGSVVISQTVSGEQTVENTNTGNRGGAYYDGMPATVCRPGDVIADPDTGVQFYQKWDCCWWLLPSQCCDGRKKR